MPTSSPYSLVPASSPRPFDTKRAQPAGLFFVEIVLDEAVDPAPSRAAAQASAQLIQVGLIAMRNHFHIAVFGIAHPSAQVKLAGFAMDKPAEAHTLHAALNQKMK